MKMQLGKIYKKAHRLYPGRRHAFKEFEIEIDEIPIEKYGDDMNAIIEFHIATVSAKWTDRAGDDMDSWDVLYSSYDTEFSILDPDANFKKWRRYKGQQLPAKDESMRSIGCVNIYRIKRIE